MAVYHWAGLLLRVCWIVWAVVWAAGWLYNLTRGPRTQRSSADWSTVLAVAAAAWLTHPTLRLATLVLVRVAWGAWLGAALLVAGTAFTIWARFVLGRMWSSAPGVKEGHELHTGGPYAITRHPIYTGMLAMVLGTVLVVGQLRVVVVAVLFLAYILVKIRTEERLMTETFGEQYAEYRRRTPQLIPRLAGPRRAG